MSILASPLVTRELRAALRVRGLPKERLSAAAAGAGFCAIFLIIGALGADKEIGRTMHRWLFVIGLSMAVLHPAKECLGLFAEDRRSQTFDLLRLAGIKPGELFAGKCLGATLVASVQLFALFPFLALPFFSGGVSLELFLDTLVCLPLLLLFTLSLCILASVCSSDEGGALVVALVVGGLVCLSTPLPYALGNALTGSSPFASGWLIVSPAYVALLIGMNFSYGPASEFPAAACFVFGWSCVFLLLAGLLLTFEWRRLPQQRQNVFQVYWRALLCRFAPAGETRGVLLDQSPFRWLAERDSALVLSAWGGIICLCFFWLLGWFAWPHAWPTTINFFITAMLLLLLIYYLELQAAARRLGEGRRDAFLELILTTPLGPTTIVDGQLAALRNQFRDLRRVVLVLFLLMASVGLFLRWWNWRALVIYAATWAAFVFWTLKFPLRSALLTMWVSLNTGRSVYSGFRAQGVGGWQMLWVLYSFYNALSALGSPSLQFPTGSMGEFAAFIVILLIIFIITAIKSSSQPDYRELLLSHFRLIAAEPVPSTHDPRLKKWKLQEPLFLAGKGVVITDQEAT